MLLNLDLQEPFLRFFGSKEFVIFALEIFSNSTKFNLPALTFLSLYM